MSIATIWWDRMEGSWDSGLLKSIFDAYPQHFIQYNQKELVDTKRAIVLVVGCPEIKPLRDYLETLKNGVAILMSEEDGFFRWKDAIPEHIDVWTQYFTPITKSEIKNRILLGAPNRIKDYKINTHLPKKYLWSFVGQVQNPYRQQMVEVLKKLPDGFLHIVDRFGGEGDLGMGYQDYLNVCCQSHIILCGAGSMSVDSFRLYEAMETEAIPITDVRCPRDSHDFNYWKAVCPHNSLFTIENWNDLTIDVLEQIKKDSPSLRNKWWFKYKQELTDKLISIANG